MDDLEQRLRAVETGEAVLSNRLGTVESDLRAFRPLVREGAELRAAVAVIQDGQRRIEARLDEDAKERERGQKARLELIESQEEQRKQDVLDARAERARERRAATLKITLALIGCTGTVIAAILAAPK